MSETEQPEEEGLQQILNEDKPRAEAPRVQEKRKRRFNLDQLRVLAEGLKWITRANQGLDLEPDQYEGMMNVKDKRERTRISVGRIRRSTYCRILATSGQKLAHGGINPYAIFEDVAEMEDTYFIAKDGEQRKEAILLKREQQAQAPSAVAKVELPAVETAPPQQKKGGIFGRWRNRGGEQNG